MTESTKVARLPGFDLHMHSTASDGALSPSELVAMAVDAAVEYMALTDHDTLAGLAEAQQAANDAGLTLIPGVELTCLWNRRVLHLLGLGIDPDYPGWKGYEARLAELRVTRADKIARKLVARGVPDNIIELARAQAGDGQIGRPHFARALLAAGVVSSENEAFDRYLGQGKPGDVKAEWPDIVESIDIIRKSGGFSILAHPTKYSLTFSRLRLLIAELAKSGIDGIEIGCPNVSRDQVGLLLRIADTLDLKISSGSDFHNPDMTWTRLGRFPAVESDRHLIYDFIRR